MTEWAIQARNLSRNFGDLKAIDKLNLKVPRGRIYGFLGPNGCGKTTAIRLLTGLLQPTFGDVDVLGLTLPRDAEKLRLKIGYMTQKFSLYDDLTIRENLQFMANVYGVVGREQTRRIDELLSLYHLQKQARQLSGSMSGGQRQRLALAAATLHQPQLLFLDEPTSAVDPENRREFWEQLFDLCDQGTSILVSTHYMDEAERCHHLAILENGVKRADGTPAELMDNMAVNVVEIEADDLRILKQKLISQPNIISAAQLGSRLRVLIKDSVKNPCDYLRQQKEILAHNKLKVVRPSLEDVFVTCTGVAKI